MRYDKSGHFGQSFPSKRWHLWTSPDKRRGHSWARNKVQKISMEERCWYFSIAASTTHSCGMQIHRQRRFRRKVFHIFHPSCGAVTVFHFSCWAISRQCRGGGVAELLQMVLNHVRCVYRKIKVFNRTVLEICCEIYPFLRPSSWKVRLPAMVTPNSSGMVRAPRKSIIITFRYCLPRDRGKIHRCRIPNIYRHLCYGQLK